VAVVSNSLMDVSTMESVWLRTRMLKAAQSEEKTRVPQDIATLYACDASDRIAVDARNLAGVLTGMDAGSGVWEAAQRLSAQAPIDTVVLRQSIAEAVISAGRYSW